MSKSEQVCVPDIGDMSDVPVIEVLVSPGDRVAADQTLVTLESDKATLDVPAPRDGLIEQVLVAVDDRVSQGTPIVAIAAGDTSGGADPAQPEEPSEPTPQATADEDAAGHGDTEAAAAPGEPTPSKSSDVPAPASQAPVASAAATATDSAALTSRAHAGPSVRGFARELGVDLGEVQGSGPKGRIVRADVLAFVRGRVSEPPAARAPGIGADLPPWPSVDFSRYGETERVPLSRIRRISGPSLARNWMTIPHVTNFDEADVTELDAFRKQVNDENAGTGAKVTLLAFVMKACVAALKRFPEFNASLDGDELILKHYYHVGFAADTPNGLVVPVIRDADGKGVLTLAEQMSGLAGRAREGALSPGDMQGGCFSISSLGGIGGVGFTPIINAPEVAILGAARTQSRVVWDDGEVRPRLILPLSLSWDHRVVDGASAARFLQYVVRLLEDFRRISL